MAHQEEINITDVIESFKAVSIMLLFDLSKGTLNEKNTILRNSISKGSVLLDEIRMLVTAGSHHNAHVLYRTLLERLAHLNYLERTNTYLDFIDWSFCKKYEYRNMARGDERFKHVLKDPNFLISDEQSKKYSEIKRKGLKWHRPDIKQELKKMNLDFLYKFGYDYSSQFVHPAYDDGLLEFHIMTKLEPNPFNDVEYHALKNAVLTSVLLLNHCLNSFDGKYITLLQTYLDNILDFIEVGKKDFLVDTIKLVKHGETGGRFIHLKIHE